MFDQREDLKFSATFRSEVEEKFKVKDLSFIKHKV